MNIGIGGVLIKALELQTKHINIIWKHMDQISFTMILFRTSQQMPGIRRNGLTYSPMPAQIILFKSASTMMDMRYSISQKM